MTFGDVQDMILFNDALREDREVQDAAIILTGDLSSKHKPERTWMPISPVERVAVIRDLEVRLAAARAVLAALGDARARRPAHFYVVTKGGR